jgi:hypothetical protein
LRLDQTQLIQPIQKIVNDFLYLYVCQRCWTSFWHILSFHGDSLSFVAPKFFAATAGHVDRSAPSSVTPVIETLTPATQETALATPSKEARERAEQKFRKKEIEARDASKAMAEYQASLIAQREKTARLRALREAKEAAEAAARTAGGDAGEPRRKTTAPA